MPVITVKAAAPILDLDVAAHEPLKDGVDRALSAAATQMGSELQASAVLFSDGHEPVSNWQGRHAGNQNITVLAAPPGTILGMLQTMQVDSTLLSARVSVLERGQAEDRALRVHNAATQLLLHGAGVQQFRGTYCDYYKQMLAAQDSGLKQLAEGVGLPVDQVVRIADAVITRRNEQTHPSSATALETEVNVLCNLMTPTLKQLCPQECQVLRWYQAVKGAFPQHFG